MIRTILTAALTACLVLAGFIDAPTAVADETVDTMSDRDGYKIDVGDDIAPTRSAPRTPSAANQGSDGTTYELDPVCDFEGFCHDYVECGQNGLMYTVTGVSPSGQRSSLGTQCIEPGDAAAPPDQPRVTPGMVRTAFERVPLPDSEISMNPAGTETLVNYPTSFYTNARPFTHTTTLLGSTITLNIKPTRYTWRHGDNTTATTIHPGRPRTDTDPYEPPDLIIHYYTTAAKRIPTSVDTTWKATWTLNNQPMGPVPGTITITGAPQPIDILEAKPVLEPNP